MLKMTIFLFLCISSCLLLWQFVIYPLLMSLVAYNFNPKDYEKEYSYELYVSILVATFNEGKVIQQRIENLFSLDYPADKCEIIVIDSGSMDSTREIVEQVISSNNSNKFKLKLIEESKRNGKASAINLGINYSRGDLILIADANSIYERNVLKKLVSKFQNSNVGAVSGRYSILNFDTDITASESFYWELENLVFTGESIVDSISTVVGTISIWRKELLDFDVCAVSEDLDMAIQVRKKGFKIGYEPEAIVYEAAATTSKDQIKQRKRTSLGTLQCIRKHFYYFLLPKNVFSLIIFPSHKILPMLSPFLLISIVIGYFLIFDLYLIFLHLFSNLIVFFILLVSLLKLKSKLTNGHNSTKFSIIAIPKIIKYVMLNEYLILLAWHDFFFGKYSVLWEKATSTREI